MARPGRDVMTRAELLPAEEKFGTPEEEQAVALCTPEDVAEVLEVPEEALPKNIDRQIATAVSWAKRYLQMPYLGEGDATITVVKDDVRCDAYIRCPQPVSVAVLWYPDGAWETLAPSTWDFDGTGIRLRPAWGYHYYDPRYSSFPTNQPWYYCQVKVTSEWDDDVDPVIVEAIAFAAAALVIRRSRLVKGLLSESIGGYSYSMQRTNTAVAGEDPFFAEAKSLLRPLRSGGGVVTP